MFIFFLCVVLALGYFRYRYKRRRVFELAGRIPGAPGMSTMLGLLPYTFNATNVIFPLLKEFTEIAFANGGIIKLWAGPLLYVGITDPKDVVFVLKNHLDKEILETLLRDLVGNSSIFGPVHIWARRRKIVAPAFTPKRLNGFMDILVTSSENLVEQLLRDNRVGTGKFVLWPYISAFTLSSISETTLGIKLDAHRNRDIPFLKAVNITLLLMTKRVFHVWLWPYWLYRLSPAYREQERCKDIFNSLTKKIIQERREALKNVNNKYEYNNSVFGQSTEKVWSLLDHIIIQSDEEPKVTDVELQEEILVLLLAGTDTSAVAICNTLKLLAMYPKIQENVYAELMNVFGDSDRRLEKSDLQELPYLYRVIKESLRLYPPTPLIGRRVKEEVKLPSGVTIPDGANIIVSMWAVHRNPKYWGPNSDSFDPDRFLTEKECGLFIPFGSGPRNCVGYQYAMMVVKIALATVLRQYRIVGEEAPTPIPDIDCTYSVMLRAKDGYEMCLERR